MGLVLQAKTWQTCTFFRVYKKTVYSRLLLHMYYSCFGLQSYCVLSSHLLVKGSFFKDTWKHYTTTIFHQLTVDVLNLEWNFRLKHQIPLKKRSHCILKHLTEILIAHFYLTLPQWEKKCITVTKLSAIQCHCKLIPKRRGLPQLTANSHATEKHQRPKM